MARTQQEPRVIQTALLLFTYLSSPWFYRFLSLFFLFLSVLTFVFDFVCALGRFPGADSNQTLFLFSKQRPRRRKSVTWLLSYAHLKGFIQKFMKRFLKKKKIRNKLQHGNIFTQSCFRILLREGKREREIEGK